MKSKFFFLGLCALALAACSIDEVSQVNDTNAISFKATANGTTAHNATTAAKGAWTVGEVQGRFDAGIAETVLDGSSSASQSITATDGALMLIPQTVEEWDPLFDPTNPGTDDATSYVVDGYTVTSTTDSDGTWYSVVAQ